MLKKPSFLSKSVQYICLLSIFGWLIGCTTEDKTQKTAREPNALPANQPMPSHQPASDSSSPVNLLPEWSAQNPTQSLSAFIISCASGMSAEWMETCEKAKGISTRDINTARAFFEQNFTAWQLNENGKTAGLITGYYEPVIHGALTRTKTARFPIYGVPKDLIALPISEADKQQTTLIVQRVNDSWQIVSNNLRPNNADFTLNVADFAIDNRTKVLKARLDGQKLVPYFNREQINAQPLEQAPILGWAEDDVGLFFLEIQGSGRLKLPDGSTVRLGYAEQNGHRYKAIGRWLMEKNHLKRDEVSAQSIKDWLAKHPQQKRHVLNQNPSYVFFKRCPSQTMGQSVHKGFH